METLFYILFLSPTRKCVVDFMRNNIISIVFDSVESDGDIFQGQGSTSSEGLFKYVQSYSNGQGVIV